MTSTDPAIEAGKLAALPKEERLRRAKLAAAALVASGRAQKIGCPPSKEPTP